MHTTDFDSTMISDAKRASASPEEQLRPVVITVIFAKIAVFALLMTTLNMPLKPAMATASVDAYAVSDLQLAAAR